MPLDYNYMQTDRFNILSKEQLLEACPAIFQKSKHHDLSERYEHLDSETAVDIMIDNGFFPMYAREQKTRDASQRAFCRHLVGFGNPDLIDDTAENIPLMTLYNSHNGRASFQLIPSLNRKVCNNGLMVGESFGKQRFMHRQNVKNAFEDIISNAVEMLKSVAENVEHMREIKLSNDDCLEFAYNAASLRWEICDESEFKSGDLSDNVYATLQTTVPEMLKERRSADKGNDLWRVFNKTQESLIRGGVPLQGLNNENCCAVCNHVTPIKRKARPINALDKQVKINRNLWDMAEEACA